MTGSRFTFADLGNMFPYRLLVELRPQLEHALMSIGDRQQLDIARACGPTEAERLNEMVDESGRAIRQLRQRDRACPLRVPFERRLQLPLHFFDDGADF